MMANGVSNDIDECSLIQVSSSEQILRCFVEQDRGLWYDSLRCLLPVDNAEVKMTITPDIQFVITDPDNFGADSSTSRCSVVMAGIRLETQLYGNA
jgi:hypothetical protein